MKKNKKSPYVIKLVAAQSNISDYLAYKDIQQIDKRYFPGSINQFKRPDGYWWAIFKDNKIVGYAGFRILNNKYIYEDGKVGFFCRAAVIEGHRGFGLQRRLIRVRIKKARQLGLEEVITYTLDNPISANNLIKCGFLTYSPKHNWSKCKNALYLKHNLNKKKKK